MDIDEGEKGAIFIPHGTDDVRLTNSLTTLPNGMPLDIPSPAASVNTIKHEEEDSHQKAENLTRSGSAASGRSTPQPNVPATSNKRANKRKAGGSAVAQAQNVDPMVLPQPIVYDDSPTIAIAPQLVPTNLVCPFTNKRFHNTKTHPINKMGFRYYPCGPSPDFSVALPLYRVIESPPANCVRFSWEDRSAYIYMTEDALTLTTDKGFRAARANVPLRSGTWFFEVICDRAGGDAGSEVDQSTTTTSGTGPHVRLGIGRRESGLNAPVGYDGFSYGIRDKTGEKVTLSQPRAHGQPFSSGDVVGVLVHLPPPPRPKVQLPVLPNGAVNPAHIVRKRVPVRLKGQLYFEAHEFAPAKEMTDMADAISDAHTPKVKNARQKAAAPGTKYRPLPSEMLSKARPLPTLPGSAIWFFKNGQVMNDEPAFQNIYDWLPLEEPPRKPTGRPPSKAELKERNSETTNDDGTLGYYPFVSCYGGGIATLNAGPTWRYPPADFRSDIVGPPSTWRALCERQEEFIAETRAIDAYEEAQARAAYIQRTGSDPVAKEEERESKSIKRSASSVAPSPLSHLMENAGVEFVKKEVT